MISKGRFIASALCCLILPISAWTGTPDALIIEHGPRDSKMICLTFDACPTGRRKEYDEKVIETLIKEKVPATLFISGRWAEKNPEKVRFLAGLKQFEIANHGYYHLHMTKLTDARVRSELEQTQDILLRLTVMAPRLFRPPYGEVDDRLAKLACEEGLITIQYDIASGDPDVSLSAEAITRSVLRQARSGSIIVFHMNGNGRRTAELLPSVISGLRAKGFEFVTVGRLLEIRAEREDNGLESGFLYLRYPALQARKFAAGINILTTTHEYTIKDIITKGATSAPLYNAGAIRCGSSLR